eukprot:Colp12_sorted_trinity150504_noHs@34145
MATSNDGRIYDYLHTHTHILKRAKMTTVSRRPLSETTRIFQTPDKGILKYALPMPHKEPSTFYFPIGIHLDSEKETELPKLKAPVIKPPGFEGVPSSLRQWPNKKPPLTTTAYDYRIFDMDQSRRHIRDGYFSGQVSIYPPFNPYNRVSS